jgi:hypothetical protein
MRGGNLRNFPALPLSCGMQCDMNFTFERLPGHSFVMHLLDSTMAVLRELRQCVTPWGPGVVRHPVVHVNT